MKLQKSLVKKILLALCLSAFLVLILYEYVDRPLAYWIEEQHFSRFILLKAMSEIASIVEGISFILLIYLAIRMGWKPLSRFQKSLFAISLSVSTAFFLRSILKILFGRYWPGTWTCNNPSFIHNNAYGFHFFHFGSAYASFPSGHAMGTFAAAAAIWLLFPRLRWCSFLICLLEVIGLLGMNYHFLGDITAGAVLGASTGIITVQIMMRKDH